MKRLTILALLLLISSVVFAQEKEAKESPVFFGGGFGITGSSNQLLINISPLIGYRFTPSIHGGGSLIYQFENYSGSDYKVHSYGVGAFLRYDLSNTLMKNLPMGIFFQADYEGTQNSFKYKKTSLVKDHSEFINRLYLGAGIMYNISARGKAFVSVSIDVANLEKDKDILPVIRAGFIF